MQLPKNHSQWPYPAMPIEENPVIAATPDFGHEALRAPRPRRVLLVDDDVEVRGLLEVVLGGDDRFDVVGQAADGAEALELAESRRPDVVVIDLLMPRMDGFAVLPRLRRALPESRIVVVSAFPDPYTLLDAVRLGADGYIDKSRVWCELVPTLVGLCAVA